MVRVMWNYKIKQTEAINFMDNLLCKSIKKAMSKFQSGKKYAGLMRCKNTYKFLWLRPTLFYFVFLVLIFQHSLFLIPSALCYNYNYLATISTADIGIIEC